MDKQKCERCSTQEYIPTHQYLGWKGNINYLCAPCWGGARELLYGKDYESSRRTSPKNQDYRLTITIGSEPLRDIHLTKKGLELILSWVCAGKNITEKIVE